ncbi:MAG: DUF1573 domain-containing protein [Candidatus Hydrogenedentota bacterium]
MLPTVWRIPMVFYFCMRIVTASPIAEIEVTSIELGRRSLDETVDQTFAVRNAGDEDLAIKVEKTSCGCLSYITGAMVIPPGESADVELRVRPEKGRNLGPNTYHATLSTNDPDRPQIELSFSVDFGASIEVSPSVLDFGTVTRGDAPAKTLAITLFDGSISGALTLDSSAGYISVMEIANEARGTVRESTWKVELRTEHADAGESHEEIVIRSDSPDRPAVRVPVRAEIRGPLSAAPERIIIPAAAPGEEIEAHVKLTASDVHQIGPIFARCADPRVGVELTPSGLTTWDLKVRFRAPEFAEYIKTSILLDDVKNTTLLTVPFRALVRAAAR